MAVIIKNLVSGSLTNTTEKITGPPSGKAWLIKSVILTNKDTTSRNLDVRVTGTSPSTVAFIAPPGMIMGPSTTVVLDNEVTLQYPAGGAQETLGLKVTATPTTGVDYVLSGVERDLS